MSRLRVFALGLALLGALATPASARRTGVYVGFAAGPTIVSGAEQIGVQADVEVGFLGERGFVYARGHLLDWADADPEVHGEDSDAGGAAFVGLGAGVRGAVGHDVHLAVSLEAGVGGGLVDHAWDTITPVGLRLSVEPWGSVANVVFSATAFFPGFFGLEAMVRI
jgi:hypothetical protein